MKKILSILFGLIATSAFAQVGYVNFVPTGITKATNVYSLYTNRASVFSIQASTTALSPCTFYLVDSDRTNVYNATTNPRFHLGTNYVTGAWPSIVSYATNAIQWYVSGSGQTGGWGTTVTTLGQWGPTNWYTNSYMWSSVVTNAATSGTNALPIMFAGQAAPNAVTTWNVDLLFANGITMVYDTNINITISYRSGQ